MKKRTLAVALPLLAALLAGAGTATAQSKVQAANTVSSKKPLKKPTGKKMAKPGKPPKGAPGKPGKAEANT